MMNFVMPLNLTSRMSLSVMLSSCPCPI
jgi:hypothetical protein